MMGCRMEMKSTVKIGCVALRRTCNGQPEQVPGCVLQMIAPKNKISKNIIQ